MRRVSGFSLIEILVVLVIIAFATSLVVYNVELDGDEEALKEQALKLQTSINFASEYAILNQQQLGLYVADNGYEFLYFSEQKWQPIEDKAVFEAVSLPDTFTLTLVQEDLPWSQQSLLAQIDWQALLSDGDEDNFLELKKMKIPQVMLLSSGEVSPFQLFLELSEAHNDSPNYIIQGEFSAPVALTLEAQ